MVKSRSKRSSSSSRKRNEDIHRRRRRPSSDPRRLRDAQEEEEEDSTTTSTTTTSRQTISSYHILEKIGEGCFGKVYRGRYRSTSQIVACKFIEKKSKTKKEIVALRREIQILKRLQHKNIILMLDTFETKHDFCIVTEFARGELFETLEDDRTLPEAIVRTIASDLVQALHYLHSNRIIHRDMKPQNILICPKGKNKVVAVVVGESPNNSRSYAIESPRRRVSIERGGEGSTPPYLIETASSLAHAFVSFPSVFHPYALRNRCREIMRFWFC